MGRILTRVALATTVVAVATATAGAAQSSPVRTLTLFQDTSHETDSLVDNAPKSPTTNTDSPRFRLSAGDELVSFTPVLDRRGGRRLGALYTKAVVARGSSFDNAVLQAEGILVLRRGTIAVAGLAGRSRSPFAVVGGTGVYEGARGSVTERESGSGAALTIRLLG